MEYLHDGSADCPLIRLYEFDSTDVARLKDAFVSLATGGVKVVPLHDQPFITSVAACQLTLQAADRDGGITRTGSCTFKLMLTNKAWQAVAELAAPFADDAMLHGSKIYHQWLDETGDISLLLSPAGEW